MGVGGTIGHSTRLTQNNKFLYSPTGSHARGVHVALMGDPTLRLHPVAPPAALARKDSRLTWQASPDAGAVYHVYAAPGENGPWTRLTEAPIRETSFAPAPAVAYMVRAVRLETGPSGSYFNASQGVVLMN
jgi:hypothetical protein